MHRNMLVIVAAVLALLIGCVGGKPEAPSAVPTALDLHNCQDPRFVEQHAQFCASDGSSAPATSSSAAVPLTSVNPKFGEPYAFENGLKLTINAPQPYTPSETASISQPVPPAFVVFDVTIDNGMQSNYAATGFSASLQSGNTEEQRVFDSAKGIGSAPTTPILPGRQSRFSIAFGAHDPSDLVMQVTAGFEYSAVIFTS